MAFLDVFSSIGSAVGSVLSPVLGFLGNRETNKTNVDMTQQTNEQNERIAQLTNNFNREERLAAQDWNWQTWQKQQEYLNSYNSPQAQAQRLKAAGLNPYTQMGDSNAQSIGSVTSSPATGTTGAPMVAPRVSNELPPGAFSDVIDKVLGSINLVQDIKGKQTDNEVKAAAAQNEIDKKKWEAVEAMQRARKGSKEYDIANQQLRQAMAQTAMLELQAKRSNLLAEQSDQAFAASMQGLRDAHDESVLRQATTKLQNQLNVNLDDRQERELRALLARTQQEIIESGSRVGLNQEQANSIRTKLFPEINNILSQTSLNNQQRNLNKPAENRAIMENKAQKADKVYRVTDWLINYIGNTTLGKLKL